MLKKIENIASTAEFKNNSRFINGLHSLPGISSGKSNISDSLSFSSAFRYLSQLKWNLRSLEHNENDEFLLEFGVDNLIFSTKVNIHDCHSSNISYRIINEDATSSSSHKYQILISFEFDPEVYAETLLASKTEYFNWLYEKFASYDSIILKNSTSPEVNDFFIDEAQSYLRYEISLIHRNLIFFLEKVTGEILSQQLRLTLYNSGDEKLIRIHQINVKL
jgi:hypothetical protein